MESLTEIMSHIICHLVRSLSKGISNAAKAQGVVKSFDKNGDLSSKFTYKNGEPSGHFLINYKEEGIVEVGEHITAQTKKGEAYAGRRVTVFICACARKCE